MAQFNTIKQKRQTGFHRLKSIFSAVMVTTTTVFAAATYIPSSAEGIINNLDAYAHEIAYSVDIKDSDNAIIPGTLKIILENQSDEYVAPLELGVSSGIFYSLDTDTQYTLRIMADKGYGSETIVSQDVMTVAQSGGSITGFTNNGSSQDSLLEYDVGYFIADPFSEYQSVRLKYATRESDTADYGEFQVLDLDFGVNLTTIGPIANDNLEVIIILEAVNQEDELVELDSVTFHTPFQVRGYLEIHSLLDDQVTFDIYVEEQDIDIEYDIQVVQDGTIRNIETLSLEVLAGTDQSLSLTFTGLKAQKTYGAILVAKYNNPYTLDYVEQEIFSLDFTTTENLHAKVIYTEFETYYEVEISINDNGDYLPFVNYRIYDPVTGEWNYSGFTQLELTENVSHGEYHFIVLKSENTEYEIEIGLYSEETNNYMVYATIPTNMEE